MKKAIRYLIVAILALCMAQTVFAEAPIAVQLDGQSVAFTDAQPRIVSNRTFLPVRAVFEAMGARVDFNDGVVTAVRGDRTVSMTVGSTAATVTKDGETAELTMDVAPFIDPELSRAFIPVRFAAQALGAKVGWDAAQRTVIIVDAEKQLAAALEGKSFTYLDKLSAHSAKYAKGIWNSEITADGKLAIDASAAAAMSGLTDGTGAAVTGKLTVPFSAAAKGATENGVKADVTEKITVDLSSVKELLALTMSSGGEADSAKQAAELDALVKGLSEDGVSIALRGDLSAGKLYVNADLSKLGKDLTEMLDVDKDTWYAIDLNSMGADVGALLAQASGADQKGLLLSALLSTLDGIDMNSAEKSYATYSAVLKAITEHLSDNGFVKVEGGDSYTATVELGIDTVSCEVTITLTMKGDEVSAYAVTFDMTCALPGVGTMSITGGANVDEKDAVFGTFVMDLPGMLNCSLDLIGGYTQGGTAPQTQPPAGAKVVDLAENLPGLSG